MLGISAQMKPRVVLDKAQFGVASGKTWWWAFFDTSPRGKAENEAQEEEDLITVSSKPWLTAVTDKQYKSWSKALEKGYIVRKHRLTLFLERMSARMPWKKKSKS